MAVPAAHRPRRRTSARLIIGRTRLARLIALISALLNPPAPAAETKTGLVLAVHPYLSYGELRLQFEPLAERLSETLGREVTVRIGSSYEDHLREIGLDRIDIAFIGPVSYVKLVERFRSKPLLARLETDGDPQLNGHLVVREESPLSTVMDLRGRSIGLGDPHSTMSNVVPRAVLLNAGIPEREIQSRQFHGHTSIAFAVLSGQVTAGAVKDEIYRRFTDRGLRSLIRLPAVSEHLFLTRHGLPASTVTLLRQQLLSLRDDERGRELLRSLHPHATGLVPVADDDYDNLRVLLHLQGKRP